MLTFLKKVIICAIKRKGDFKLRKMYALQEEQKKYWDLNGDYIKSLIDEILIKCGDDNETLDKKIADMVESVYTKK